MVVDLKRCEPVDLRRSNGASSLMIQKKMLDAYCYIVDAWCQGTPGAPPQTIPRVEYPPHTVLSPYASVKYRKAGCREALTELERQRAADTTAIQGLKALFGAGGARAHEQLRGAIGTKDPKPEALNAPSPKPRVVRLPRSLMVPCAVLPLLAQEAPIPMIR